MVCVWVSYLAGCLVCRIVWERGGGKIECARNDVMKACTLMECIGRTCGIPQSCNSAIAEFCGILQNSAEFCGFLRNSALALPMRPPIFPFSRCSLPFFHSHVGRSGSAHSHQRDRVEGQSEQARSLPLHGMQCEYVFACTRQICSFSLSPSLSLSLYVRACVCVYVSVCVACAL